MAQKNARQRARIKGRPRKIGARHPNGELVTSVPDAEGPLIPDLALRRRAEAIGEGALFATDPAAMNAAARAARRQRLTALATDGKAGHALGRLLRLGCINFRQFRAGERYANLWRAYLSMRGLPSRGMVCSESGPTPLDEELLSPEERRELEDDRQRLARRFHAAEAAVAGCQSGAAVRTVLGELLLRDTLPETATRARLACRGLDVLADHLKLREDEEEKVSLAPCGTG